MASLRVVIVNFRTPQLTIDCLESLVPELQNLIDAKAIVVDNCSGDDSVTRLNEAIQTRQWQPWVRLLSVPKNGGFSAGNHAALRYLKQTNDFPDFVWLLNPDTILRPHAGRTLIEFLENCPHVGIVGSRLLDSQLVPQTSAFRFHTILSQLDDGCRLGLMSRLLKRFRVPMAPCNHDHPADWVSGASMMIRREVLEQVGFLDEKYFLYFEETDFCYRVKQVGWQIWYHPQSELLHLEGQSTGVQGSKSGRKRMPPYWFKSRARFFRKNHGDCYLFLANLAFLTGYIGWRIRRRIQNKPDPDPPHFLQDFLRYSFPI